MSSTRDANLGAGVESGCSSKKAIGGEKGKLDGKPLPDRIRGTVPQTQTQSVSRGHKWKNG